MSGRTPAAWTWFMAQVVAMEPDTENSGTYTNKPGYHGTRAENQARDKIDGSTDYSVRYPFDLLGPSDCSAAGDWTFRAAQSGDYSRMAVYGRRVRAAFDARDPRLAGWVEFLGQTDVDAVPEGLVFHNWTTRTPDDSHAWHVHESEKRAYAESYDNKKTMLSILRGESLAQYLLSGGVLLRPDGKGTLVATIDLDQDPDFTALKNRAEAILSLRDPNPVGAALKPEPNEIAKILRAMDAQVKANGALLAEIKAAVAVGGVDIAVFEAAVERAVRTVLLEGVGG